MTVSPQIHVVTLTCHSENIDIGEAFSSETQRRYIIDLEKRVISRTNEETKTPLHIGS